MLRNLHLGTANLLGLGHQALLHHQLLGQGVTQDLGDVQGALTGLLLGKAIEHMAQIIEGWGALELPHP